MPGTRTGNQVANGNAQRESDEENVSIQLKIHSMIFCLQKACVLFEGRCYQSIEYE